MVHAKINFVVCDCFKKLPEGGATFDETFLERHQIVYECKAIIFSDCMFSPKQKMVLNL